VEYLNLNNLVSPWLAHLAVDHSVHTIRLYRVAVEHFLLWYGQAEQRPLTLDDLTPIALVGYRNSLQHQLFRAPNTINAHVAALRAWCSWLSTFGHLPANPAARLHTLGRQASTSPKGLKGKHIDALLREAQRGSYPARNYAILQMLLQTGMRISECVDLNITDITFGQHSGSVRIRTGKGNKARIVPLNGSIRKALADYMGPRWEVTPTLDAIATAWPLHVQRLSHQPLWISRKGNRLSNPAMRRLIAELVAACACRQLVPKHSSAHTFRHTFAMNYLQDNPGDLFGLATLLGHSSLDTTRIYGNPSEEQLAARLDQMRLNAYGD
jgi:site-specific recombinase XerD